MKIFIILFVIIILPVIGSAGMMSYIDKKHLSKKHDPGDKKTRKYSDWPKTMTHFLCVPTQYLFAASIQNTFCLRVLGC